MTTRGVQTDLGVAGPRLEQGTSSVFQSVWKRWWVVVLVIVVVVDAALLLVQVAPPTYTSTTELVVRDPQNSQVFDLPSQSDPERYVADQVQILQSSLVANRAAMILAESNLDGPVPEADDFTPPSGRLDVSSQETSNVITITFEDENPEVAHAAVNAVATAYGDVRREEALRSSSSALDQLDGRIEELDRQIEDIATRIDPDLPPETQGALDEHSQTVLARILELQQQLLEAGTQAEIDIINGQLEGLTAPAATIDSIVSTAQPADIQGLLSQQTALVSRRADLAARRDEIAVSAELAASGVTFSSPSAGAVESGFSTLQIAVLGILVGAVIGTALAHWLASRDRRISHEDQPSTLLDAPLLAEIPRFAHERITSALPVQDHPRSGIAESFRFAASSVGIRRAATGAQCLAVVSGTVGDGKTTVTANLALALAGASAGGQRIVVVDADFGSQQLSTLLIGGNRLLGLTDVALEGADLSVALREVNVPGGGSLFVLPRGLQRTNAPSLFSDPRVRDVFDRLRDEFDVVLVDTPPMLQIAYTNALVALADATIVIAGHRTDGSDLQEVAERLAMLGTQPLGYLYTMGPLRERMTQTGGSMTDIIGDLGLEVAPQKRGAG